MMIIRREVAGEVIDSGVGGLMNGISTLRKEALEGPLVPLRMWVQML